MNKKLKFYLITGLSNENKSIFRYNSNKFKDILMWRDTEKEAKADFIRWYYNKRDMAKGLNEVMEIEEVGKYNKLLIS